MSGDNCPDCGKPLKPRKAWGGLLACFCQFGGRRPSAATIERAVERAERECIALTPLERTSQVTREAHAIITHT